MGISIGQPFPQVPSQVKPSDVPSVIPGEEERAAEAEAIEAPIQSAPEEAIPEDFSQAVPLEEPPQEQGDFFSAQGIGSAATAVAGAVSPVFNTVQVAQTIRDGIMRIQSREKNRLDSQFQSTPPNGGEPEEKKISDRELDMQMSLFKIKAEMGTEEKSAAGSVAEEDEPDALANDVEQILLELSGEEFAPEGQGPESSLENFMLRAQGSLGLTQEEALRPLVKAFGSDNVTQRGGELFYRERKGNPFVRYDESDFTIADVIADNFGAIVETAAAIPTELAVLAGAGAAAGTGVGAVAAPAIAITAPAAGAAVGVAARRGLFPDEFQDQDAAIGEEMAWSIGMSYVAPWMIKGAGRGSRFMGKKLKTALESSPDARAKKIAEAMVELEDTTKVLGRQSSGTAKNLTEAVQEGYGAVDKYQKDLGQAVGAIKKDAIELAGDDLFVPQSGMAKMQEMLSDNNVFFKKNGEAVFFDPDVIDVDDIFLDDEGLMVVTDAAKNIKRKLTQEQFNKEFGFGQKGGNVVVGRLVNQYNKILRKVNLDGGVQVKSLQDMVDIYTDMSDFGVDQLGNRLVKKDRRLARNVRNAMSEDRNAAFTEIFQSAGKQGPEGELWKETFKEFGSRNADFNQLRKLFNKADTARDFGKQLFKSQKSTAAFKRLVGGDSAEWSNVKNEWLLDTFKRAKDPESGLFLAARWQNSFKLVEDNGELLNTIFDDKSQVSSLKRLVKNVGDIPFGDLITPAKARNIVQDFLKIGISDHLMPTTKAEILWGWFGKNIDMTEEMLDGLMAEARKAPTKSVRNRIFETMSRMKFFISNSKIVKNTFRHPVTKKLTEVASYAPLGTGPAPISRFAGQVGEEVLRGRTTGPTRRELRNVKREGKGPAPVQAEPASFQPQPEQQNISDQFLQQVR